MSENSIVLSFRDGVRKILFNKPTKKNAISPLMYRKLTAVLREDAQDDQIVVTIITGNGDFYSSGNDLFSSEESSLVWVEEFIQALIEYPKIIIAVLNGPAIGVAATTAVLCDIIYASDRAYFQTPFVPLALCAEGTSSYTFPRILGRSKASEMLFLNRKLSAQEAYQFGLVSKVIPHEKLDDFIEELHKYGTLPVSSVKLNKSLVMHELEPILTLTNKRECKGLEKCLESGEYMQMLEKVMKNKSKL